MRDGWNYRVVKRKFEGEDIYGIHEVYYENDEPVSCTKDPVYPLGGGSIDSLKEDINHYLRALNKPTLDYKDFN